MSIQRVVVVANPQGERKRAGSILEIVTTIFASTVVGLKIRAIQRSGSGMGSGAGTEQYQSVLPLQVDASVTHEQLHGDFR